MCGKCACMCVHACATRCVNSEANCKEMGRVPHRSQCRERWELGVLHIRRWPPVRRAESTECAGRGPRVPGVGSETSRRVARTYARRRRRRGRRAFRSFRVAFDNSRLAIAIIALRYDSDNKAEPVHSTMFVSQTRRVREGAERAARNAGPRRRSIHASTKSKIDRSARRQFHRGSSLLCLAGPRLRHPMKRARHTATTKHMTSYPRAWVTIDEPPPCASPSCIAASPIAPNPPADSLT